VLTGDPSTPRNPDAIPAHESSQLRVVAGRKRFMRSVLLIRGEHKNRSGCSASTMRAVRGLDCVAPRCITRPDRMSRVAVEIERQAVSPLPRIQLCTRLLYCQAPRRRSAQRFLGRCMTRRC
jgi:hypothetical protein